VDALISILKAYPAVQVRLEGYTDNTGNAEANQKLSQDRAEAVKTMLVNGGIDAGRLTTAGYGQDKPVASNDTDEGRAKNRRTELVVVKR
jgi:K(+)-stimulated pyrophosphate-energized sodium pump